MNRPGRPRCRRVLVVGAGGLGCPALLALGAHVDEVGIADDDVVELSNLNRQILHRTQDIGRRKIDSAKEALLRRFPSLTVTTIDARVGAGGGASIISGWDVVIDGTDSIESKFEINDLCVRASVPLVHGGCVRYSGQIMSVLPGHACYRCLFEAPPPPGAAPSCQEAGIIGAFAGLIGALQAKEALAILAGKAELAGALLVVDGRLVDGQSRRRLVRVKRRPGCEAHAPQTSEAISC